MRHTRAKDVKERSDSMFQAAWEAHKRSEFGIAESGYRTVLAARPHARATHNLGLLCYQTKRLEEAEVLLRSAVALDPSDAKSLSNLGLVLHDAGKWDEALIAYGRALSLQPNNPEVDVNLGNTFRSMGRLDRALSCYRHAISLRPSFALAHCNSGSLLKEQGNIEQALSCYRLAIHYDRTQPASFYNLGNLFMASGQYEEAQNAFRVAIELKHDYLEAHLNLGNCFLETGRVDEAFSQFTGALGYWPDSRDAHLPLSFARLLRGHIAEGFFHYEWRPRPRLPSSLEGREMVQWDGSDLAGESILLFYEQGLGDTLQFLRFVPMVQARGGNVHLLVQESLYTLARELQNITIVKHDGTASSAHRYCSLMSLAYVLGITLETIPSAVPYLSIPNHAQEQVGHIEWGEGTKRVGLVWSGSRSYANDTKRSLRYEDIVSILDVEGIDFYSFQYEAEEPPCGWKLYTLPMNNDMAVTAALLTHMDLLISVDTSVAHLAGCLGIETWVMLPYYPDWRWMVGRDDTPWYPRTRLFRQPSRGDWKSVLDSVRDSLKVFRRNA